MEAKQKKPDIQLRSPEVQQLLGRMPGGFICYGATLILLCLLIFLAVAAFVPYEQSVPVRVRIMPNVACCEVRAATDGTIVHCNTSDNTQVAIGDTLLTYTVGNRLSYLLSPESGNIHFLRFCIPGESIKSEEPLFEVRSASQTKQTAYAIVDSLPSTVNLSLLHGFTHHIGASQITFLIKQTLDDSETGIRRVLLQSDQKVAITQEVTTTMQIPIESGSLLKQLIGDRFH